MVLLGLLAKVTRPRVGVTLVFCCPGRQGAFNPATLAPGPYKETRLHLFKKKKKLFCKPGLIYCTFLVAGRPRVAVQAVPSWSHSSKVLLTQTHTCCNPALPCVGLRQPLGSTSPPQLGSPGSASQTHWLGVGVGVGVTSF